MSAACASAVALAGVSLPFEKAQAALAEMTGLSVDDNRVQRIYLAANLAIEPLPGLAVGGGLSFMASTAADGEAR